MTPPIAFDTTYARLPERLYARLSPTPVARPGLLRVNDELAVLLGIDPAWLASAEGVAVLAGNAVPAGATPLAQAYAGHQFGRFVPQLGDGRALLLGEIVGRDGVRRDLALKGSGRTPYSRGGDGRAALGPVLREYLVAEAMHALGVPTTRALAAVFTGEAVFREQPLPGAVLARVAASHLRVGTFELAAARRDREGLGALADHAIERHDPAARGAPNPYLALLDGVIARQAELVSRWQLLGFVHGVMNTDNTTISGETIDYGPCAFLDAYDEGAVWSSIDHGGRYAYGNQPGILLWNLSRLAEALLPLLDEDQGAAVRLAEAALERFEPTFAAAYGRGLARKLGLSEVRDGDGPLGADLLAAMAAQGADFTLTFRRLADLAEVGGPDRPDGDERRARHAVVRALFRDGAPFDAWATRWHARIALEGTPSTERAAAMRAVSPAFIPRNHNVEAAIAAAYRGDLAVFRELHEVLRRPYQDQPGRERYLLPPSDDERVTATFCGT